MSIALIILGVALLAEGSTITTEYSKLLSTLTQGSLGAADLGGGMTIQFIAGGAAVILGILGFLELHPILLVASAVIGIGGSLILSASDIQRINALRVQSAGLPEGTQRVARGVVSGTVGAQMLAGAAAIVLGVLGLTPKPMPPL